MAAVLFVDDEPAIREMLGTVLKLAGHLPLNAADAEEARSVLRSHGVDLALAPVGAQKEGTPALDPILQRKPKQPEKKNKTTIE